MTNGETEIGELVEQLCQAGCDRVYDHLKALCAGRLPAGIGPLAPDKRRRELDELQSIMAPHERNAR